MEPYKIILVDDHSLFRNGLRGPKVPALLR